MGLNEDKKVWGESKQCTIHMDEISKEFKSFCVWVNDQDSLVNLLIYSQYDNIVRPY